MSPTPPPGAAPPPTARSRLVGVSRLALAGLGRERPGWNATPRPCGREKSVAGPGPPLLGPGPVALAAQSLARRPARPPGGDARSQLERGMGRG